MCQCLILLDQPQAVTDVMEKLSARTSTRMQLCCSCLARVLVFCLLFARLLRLLQR